MFLFFLFGVRASCVHCLRFHVLLCDLILRLAQVSFLKSIGLSVKTSAFTLSMMGVGEFGGTALSTVLGDRIPLLKVEILAIASLVASVATAGLTVVHVYSGVLVVVIGKIINEHKGYNV